MRTSSDAESVEAQVPALDNARIAVLGLGYVGLPLAVAFGKRLPTLGYDIDGDRIDQLKSGRDRTLEVESEDLARSAKLRFSANPADLADSNVFVVTVPTPIDEYKQPDLSALIGASTAVGKAIRPGGIVVFESTVYPGATEERCVPTVEKISGLTFNRDFFAGYSPERANPGDREHRLASITKVVAGSTPAAAEFVEALYSLIVPAGVYRASSIRIAEAAKVIENTQRDLNIALINELSIIFSRLGLDTTEVLEAAGTKWNFLPFRPGLVGGHCIGVDPYYLTHKAQSVGYHPEVILAGRRINDGMGAHVVSQLVKGMIGKRIQVQDARVLIMGLTFKENCPDLRNTRVIDILRELKEYHASVDVVDPWVEPESALREYGIRMVSDPVPGTYDAIIVAVAHQAFRDMSSERIHALGRKPFVLYDLKSILPRGAADLRL